MGECTPLNNRWFLKNEKKKYTFCFLLISSDNIYKKATKTSAAGEITRVDNKDSNIFSNDNFP